MHKNKMENRYNVGTIPTSNIKILERAKIDTLILTHEYMTAHFTCSLLDTCTSIKRIHDRSLFLFIARYKHVNKTWRH